MHFLAQEDKSIDSVSSKSGLKSSEALSSELGELQSEEPPQKSRIIPHIYKSRIKGISHRSPLCESEMIKIKILTVTIKDAAIFRIASNETFGSGPRDISGWMMAFYPYEKDGTKVTFNSIEAEDIPDGRVGVPFTTDNELH
ncbi:13858_t:CDS:2 [Funneliformis geosporum]|uniref:13858_t:CDS:1 n=1 Tax=Funneliformis geosporum TaxID=1117311 RepID=A0A9W4WL87_9GLOM|nr:13858_t:CDS:2 [Funneliformis geosporum]